MLRYLRTARGYVKPGAGRLRVVLCTILDTDFGEHTF